MRSRLLPGIARRRRPGRGADPTDTHGCGAPRSPTGQSASLLHRDPSLRFGLCPQPGPFAFGDSRTSDTPSGARCCPGEQQRRGGRRGEFPAAAATGTKPLGWKPQKRVLTALDTGSLKPRLPRGTRLGAPREKAPWHLPAPGGPDRPRHPAPSGCVPATPASSPRPPPQTSQCLDLSFSGHKAPGSGPPAVRLDILLS